MENFTPWSALAGGALIGLSAVLLMALNGRIAGISGIVGGLLGQPNAGDWLARAAFTIGLVIAPLFYALMHPLPAISFPAQSWALVAGGLIVGFGTAMGSGCTSGHGVCGMARLSKRSILATLTFMATGFATVFIVRHVAGF